MNYSNFRIWFDEHYVPYKNNQIDLDKDLLVQGNKVYSPETCVFLLHYQNTMFERSAKDKIYEKEVLLLIEQLRTARRQISLLRRVEIDAEIKEALIKAMEVTAEEFDLFKV